MAKVPLRAYNSEIEKLTENGHTQEAIAHCKHILKYYPKHIDTYRLLGKAFLESLRYGEAADILQRVLSVIPDDFISQIGLSLVREDEGNLDAAIYHMERAFEVQPSNPVIQDELRRLYGRRDGVEPPKIRLTRGALVRMYTRGELYPQAIAEIRAALAEDPQRIDLQIILARLHYFSGQKVQSAEVCSKLVSQIPYCYEANRILAEVLPGTSRSEDARIYQDRINALDPYLAFIAGNQLNSSDVPDNAVQIDRLEYQPDQDEAAQPEWTKSAGVNLEETTEEEGKPDWMTGETENLQTAADNIQNEPEAPPTQPADMPDWLAAAGWSLASGNTSQLPIPANIDSSEEELPISPADIPEWLRDLAPESSPSLSNYTNEGTNDEDQVWLQQILGSESDQPVNSQEDLVSPQNAEDLRLKNEAIAQTQSTDTDIFQPAEPLGAIDVATPEGPIFPIGTTAPTQETKKVVHDEDLPDWIKGLGIPDSKASESEILTQPDSTEQKESTGSPETSLTNSILPESQLEAQPVFQPEDDMDAAMAWLEALAAKQGADEATLLTQPDQRSEIIPEWNQKEQNNTVETSILSETGREETSTFSLDLPKAESESSPEALEDAQPVSMPAITTAESPESALKAEDRPDWLSEIARNETPEESAFVPAGENFDQSEPIPTMITEQPDTIMEISKISINQETPPLSSVILSTTDFSAVDDIDPAFAWLEALAAKQGADEATLLIHAEDRHEEPLAWVHMETFEAQDDQKEASAIPEPSAEEVSPVVESQEPTKPVEIPSINEWIPEESTNTSKTQPITVHPSIDSLPEPVPESEEISSTQPVATDDVSGEWKLELVVQSVPDKTLDQIENEQLPEWLQDLSRYSNPNGLPGDSADDHEEPLDWLKGIEGTEDDLTDSPVSVVRSPIEPEWMNENQNFKEEEKQPVEELEIEDGVEAPDTTPTEIPEIEEIPAGVPGIISPEGQSGQADRPGELLSLGQQAFAKGNVESALGNYDQLIQSSDHLDDTIHDLRDALDRFPVDINIWQSLGDAYSRSNRIQDALDAYTKAEELLK